MTKRTYKGWTQADDAELVLLREAAVSTKVIAIILKRTSSSVTNRITVLKLPVGKGKTWQVEMDFGHSTVTTVPESKIVTVQGSQPKPSWWTSMMWWRK